MKYLIILLVFIYSCSEQSPTGISINKNDTTYTVYNDTLYDSIYIKVPIYRYVYDTLCINIYRYDTIKDTINLNNCYMVDNLGRSYPRFKTDSLSYWMIHYRDNNYQPLLWSPVKLKCN
jgi:hypothetical protein